MVMTALSPASVLAAPDQVNPQVRTDLQGSLYQAALAAEKTARSVRTDTVTISARALKMASDNDADAREVEGKPREPRDGVSEGSESGAGRNGYAMVSYKA